MISMIRIDDRLIHGQVAVMWTKELGVDRIIVANDKVAANEIQKSALLLAAPASVKAAIVDVDKGIKILTDERSKNLKILVLCNNPVDVLRILAAVGEQPKLNISNFGRQLGGETVPKRAISDSVYMSSAEEKEFQAIFDQGYDITYQPVPTQPAKSLKKLMEK